MAKFVKQTFTGYKEVQGGYSDPECEYVIQSINEYGNDAERIEKAEKEVRSAKHQFKKEIREWIQKYNTVVDAYNSLKEYAQELEEKESLPEGMVAISEEELNGYKKAVRIVRDRAVQQIDKAKADEHGYMLLRADKRKYERNTGKAWLITKSTPYSIKIGLNEAFSMIERDLKEFYGLKELLVFGIDKYGCVRRLSVKDLLNYYERYFKNGDDTSGIGNEDVVKALEWMDKTNGVMAFEISRIAKNAATGCYEVSYWATALNN